MYAIAPWAGRRCERDGVLSRISRVVAESGLRGAALRFVGRALRSVGALFEAAGRRLVADRDLNTLTSKATRELLAANIILKGRHGGQRAFVVGAGPSLRDQDLSALASGTVIAVNQSFLHLRKVCIDPDYVMVIDGAYFLPDMRSYIEDVCAYAADVGAELLVTPDFLPLVPTLAKVPTFHLIGQIMRDREFGFGGATQDVDLTQARPAYETVVHGAVAAAIYMRFSEIYILGCDGSFFVNPNRPFEHVYESSPYDHSTGTTSQLFGETQPELLQRAALEFESFIRLAEIASRQGSTLYNAGVGGHLEVLPRRSLDTLRPNALRESRVRLQACRPAATSDRRPALSGSS